MRVRTSDGKSVVVSPAAARASRLLSDLAEAFGGRSESGVDAEINLSNVTAKNLAIITEFCEREEAHRLALADASAGEDRPTKIKMAQSHEDWKEQFLESMQDGVPSLMSAANFMHVECVMEACSVNIAEFIKKRTPDEIREYFRLRRQRHVV